MDEAIVLQDTNNLVLWLSPSPVVAKVSAGHHLRLEHELAVGRFLKDVGAPVVAPTSLVPALVHQLGPFEMTFWDYSPERGLEPEAEVIATSLAELHGALTGFRAVANEGLGSFASELADIEARLQDHSFAQVLSKADRQLLLRALQDRGLEESRRATVIHGSPHRFNILSVNEKPRFIDFETVCLGPLEWDLAHTDAEVALAYPVSLDFDLLARFRTLVSAKTSGWCWEQAETNDKMRLHAEHHLRVVREALN